MMNSKVTDVTARTYYRSIMRHFSSGTEANGAATLNETLHHIMKTDNRPVNDAPHEINPNKFREPQRR